MGKVRERIEEEKLNNAVKKKTTVKSDNNINGVYGGYNINAYKKTETPKVEQTNWSEVKNNLYSRGTNISKDEADSYISQIKTEQKNDSSKRDWTENEISNSKARKDVLNYLTDVKKINKGIVKKDEKYKDVTYDPSFDYAQEVNNKEKIINDINSKYAVNNTNQPYQTPQQKQTMSEEDKALFAKTSSELETLRKQRDKQQADAYKQYSQDNFQQVDETNEEDLHNFAQNYNNLGERFGASTLRAINSIPKTATSAWDWAKEGTFTLANDRMKNRLNNGEITQQEYDEWYKDAYFNSQDPNNASQQFKKAEEQLQVTEFAGLNDEEIKGLQAVDGAINNLVNYGFYGGLADTFGASQKLIGDAVTLGMSASSATDTYMENIANGMDVGTASLNAGLKGVVSFLTERIPAQNFVEAWSNPMGKMSFGKLAKMIGGQSWSEGREEGYEYGADVLIDALTTTIQKGGDLGFFINQVIDNFDAEELVTSMELGMASGAIIGTLSSAKGAVGNVKQYNKFAEMSKVLGNDIEVLKNYGDIDGANKLQETKDAIDLACNDFEEKASNVSKGVSFESDSVKSAKLTDGIQDFNTAIQPDYDAINKRRAEAYGVAQALLNERGIDADIEEYMSWSDYERNNVATADPEVKKLVEKGYKIRYTNTLGKGVNALYLGNNQIALNPNSDTPLASLVHEVLHSVEKGNKTNLTKLVNTHLQDIYKNPSINQQAYDNLEMGKYKTFKEFQDGYNKKISDAYIKAINNYNNKNHTNVRFNNETLTSEYLANTIENTLGQDKNFIDKMVKYDSSLVYRMFQKIKSLGDNSSLNNLQNAFYEAFKNNNIDPETGTKLSINTDDNYGYHYGSEDIDLTKKSETLGVRGGRGTGAFGTGTYFFGSQQEKSQYGYNNGKKTEHKVNFDDYNLYKVKNADEGYAIHDYFKKLDDYFDYKGITDYNELEQKFSDYEKVSEDIYVDGIDKKQFTELVDDLEYTVGKYQTNNILSNSIDENKLQELEWSYPGENGVYDFKNNKYVTNEELFDIVDQEKLSNQIYKLSRDYNEQSRAFDNLDGANYITKNMPKIADILNVDVNTLNNIIENAKATAKEDVSNKNLKTDSLGTRVMKSLGYEGIDVRGIEGLDNSTYGSVIYDLKPQTILYSINMKDSQDYNQAVKDGDVAKQQELVDKVANNKLSDSQARDEEGKLVYGFHATPSEPFRSFDKEKASPEGDLGGSLYFSNKEEDARRNYHEDGPDIQSRIERLADSIETDEEISYDEALKRAKEKVIQGEGSDYRVFLDIKNPIYIDEKNSTQLLTLEQAEELNGGYYSPNDFEEEYEYYNQIYSDMVDTAVDNIKGLSYDDTVKLKQILYEHFDEGIDFEKLKKIIGGGFHYDLFDYDAEYSEYANSYIGTEVARRIVENLGYDGIIDYTVSKKFPGMNLDPDTIHYAVFNPEQVKSADPITYDTDGNVIPLEERFNTNNEDMYFSINMDDETQKVIDYINSTNLSQEQKDKMIKDIARYGAIENGESPKKNVFVPNKTDVKGEAKNVSKTIRTMVEADKLNANQEAEVLSNIEDFTYAPKTIKKFAQDAQAHYNEIGEDNLYTEYMSSKGSNRDIAYGIYLLNALENKNDPRANAVRVKVVSEISDIAQSFSIISRLYKRLTPEGQYQALNAWFNRVQRQWDEKYKNKSVRGVVNQDLLERYVNATTESERKSLEHEIKQDFKDQEPKTILNKLNQIRYLAMLGNFRTHVRNLFGNGVMAGMAGLKDVYATGIEKGTNALIDIVNATTGKDIKHIDTSKSLVNPLAKSGIDKELIDYGGEMYDVVKYEIEKRAKYDNINTKGAFEDTHWYGKTLNYLSRVNSVWLDNEDFWFSKQRFRISFAEYLKANNLNKNNISDTQLDEACEYALKEAEKATFRDFNSLAHEINRYADKNNVFRFVKDSIVPFTTTPFNIVKRGFEYSPLSLISTIPTAGYKLATGEINANQFIDTIASGLSGGTLTVLGWILAKYGLFKTKDEDKDRKNAYDEEKGEQKYAITLPNGTYTIDWLTPAIMPLSIGAELYNKFGVLEDTNEGNMINLAINVGAKVVDPIVETTMLKSLKETLQSFSNTEGGFFVELFNNTVSNYLSQPFSTLGGQITRTLDDTRRTTRSEDVVERTGRKILNKLPITNAIHNYYGIGNEPYINKKGEEQKQEPNTGNEVIDFFGRALLNMASPGYFSSKDIDKYDEEMYRLYNSTGNINVFPSSNTYDYTSKGINYTLYGKDYTEYAKAKYKRETENVNELIDSKNYSKLGDESKAEAIGSIRKICNMEAKAESLSEKGIKLQNQDSEYANWYNAKKSGISMSEYVLSKMSYNDSKGSKDGNGNSTVQKTYVEKINNLGMTDKEKNTMYDQYYGDSNFVNVVNNIGLDDSDMYAIKEAKALSEDSLDFANRLKEKGLLNYLVNYCNENGIAYSKVGLSKSAIQGKQANKKASSKTYNSYSDDDYKNYSSYADYYYSTR